MKAVWVDAGNDPHWERITAYGITRLYFPTSDPVADVRRRLADTKARGLTGGLYSAWNWEGYAGTGAHYAEAMHAAVKAIAPTATATWPKIQLDDETHDPDRILDLIRRWRALRPNTDTSWTLECFQGGWFSPQFCDELAQRKIRVVPQCYGGTGGAMDYAVDTLVAARDLTKRGLPDALITPFYDAARLPFAWDGFAFTMGRLPWG
jgi:hypothetical protein